MARVSALPFVLALALALVAALTLVRGVDAQSCSAGSFFNATASACQTCGNGTVSAGGATTACTACTAGTVPAANLTICVSCTPGTFGLVGFTNCEPCETGSNTTTSGATLCTCDDGYFLDTSTLQCVVCPTMLYAGLVLAGTLLGMILLIAFITGEGKAQSYSGMLQTAISCATWLYVLVSQSDIAWPQAFSELYNTMFSWLSIINFQQVSPECFVSNLPYLYEWIVFAAFPVYAYLIVIFVTLVRRSIIRCFKESGFEFEHGNWLTINFNFMTVMITFMTIYTNLLIQPLRIWVATGMTYTFIDETFFWACVGTAGFVVLAYVFYVFMFPFSRGTAKWKVYDLLYADGVYTEESVNELIMSDRGQGNFLMGLIIVPLNIISLLFTTIRGYVALAVLGNLCLVIFQFVSQFLDADTAHYNDALIGLVLGGSQVGIYLGLNLVKGLQLGHALGKTYVPFAAPSGDTNDWFITSNVLELCALLTDFTHGLFGYLYAVNVIPASATWATTLCLALAGIYFAVTVIVVIFVIVVDNLPERMLCKCLKPNHGDYEDDLADDSTSEAPYSGTSKSKAGKAESSMSRSSMELLAMSRSTAETPSVAGGADDDETAV